MLTINHFKITAIKCLCIYTLLLSQIALAEHAQPTIKLGMSTALTGPAKQIGEQLALGSNIYFNKINKENGINGHYIHGFELNIRHSVCPVLILFFPRIFYL